MDKIIIDRNIKFYTEADVLQGVARTAENVKKDIELITGCYPAALTEGESAENCVIYGTVGQSAILQTLEQGGKLNLSSLQGKWEVYAFQIVSNPTPEIEQAIVIAGSDKRGTIYVL